MRAPRTILVLSAVWLGGWAVPAALGQQKLVINRFDTDAEAAQWYKDWGDATLVSMTRDPSKDADGNSGSGALKLVIDYDQAIPGNNVAFTKDFHQTYDLTNYDALELDIYIDPSSPTRGSGSSADHGYFSTGTRDGDGWSLNWDSGRGFVPTSQWIHLSVPMASYPNGPHADVRALTMQNWGGDNLTGRTTLWIDNILFVPKLGGPKSTLVINDFNTADEVAAWARDTNCTPPPDPCQPIPTIEFDPNADALGDSASGAMKITLTFDNPTFGGWNQLLLNRAPFPGAPADVRDYNIFIARVKVTPDSPKDPSGVTHGPFAWVFRNDWGWNQIFGVNMPDSNGPGVDANGWYVFEVPMPDPSALPRDKIQALTLQIWGGGTWPNLNGTMTFWVDHVVLGRSNGCVDPANCESCFNLMDDNGNGLVDCADPDCAGIPHCIETACTNFLDDEGDGLIDCADPDCAEDPACKTNTPWADTDGDSDVDQSDFGEFQACFSGAGAQFRIGCGKYDRNHDLHIDMIDYQKFVDCFSGPNIPASSTCGQ